MSREGLSEGLSEGLRTMLGAFDGRAMSLLGEAEAAFGGEPGYVDTLVALVPGSQTCEAGPFVGSGATWLLKSFLEKGGALSAEQTGALISALPQKADGAHWSTALHLCQSIRYLDLTVTQGSSIRGWLKPLLTHNRPFVRAWSLDALAHLAKRHEEHRADFAESLRIAGEDPAASVRARARKLGLG
ncbi:MAG: hypothetical protein QNI87_14800 [Erythrobacter sp.]|uniref:hypothetical protein n=1 Tax=Erythrobacter sp. TaxID=1042 RepID=UPI0026079C47|nr:hypothetical protein [Erythrobacter sp.]MDJ0979791.1 hypothetical protein [Erythrobacter sp.]